MKTYGFFAAKVRGESHVRTKKPCQDSYYFKANKEAICIAMADGLSSESHSATGSQIATKSSVDFIMNNLKVNICADELLQKSVEEARNKLQEKANSLKVDISKLATTLIVCLVIDATLYTIHIGDGAVVAFDDNGVIMVSPPENIGYSNVVAPVTMSGYKEHLRASQPLSDISALSLMTDGCQGFSLLKEDAIYKPFKQFWSGLYANLSVDDNKRIVEQHLKKFLLSDRIKEHSGDDKTFAFLTFKGKSK